MYVFVFVVEPPEILDTHQYLYPTLELDTSEPIVSSKQVVKTEDVSKGSWAGVKVKGEEVKYTKDTNSMYMYIHVLYTCMYMYIVHVCT